MVVNVILILPKTIKMYWDAGIRMSTFVNKFFESELLPTRYNSNPLPPPASQSIG